MDKKIKAVSTPTRNTRTKATADRRMSKGNSSPASKTGKIPQLRMEPLPIDTSASKFVLHPEKPAKKTETPVYENLGELPETYGSKKLFLTARDAQWLFAYWDLNSDQFQQAEAAAHDHKVFLQVYHANGERVQQIQIHLGAKNWYLNVSQPDTTFYAEIGYYRHDGGFEVVCRSGAAATPRDGLSWKTHSEFATIPFNFSFHQLRELIKDNQLPGEDLADALARLEASGVPLPFETFLGRELTEDAHQALLRYLNSDIIRRIRMGSGEITEILRKQLGEQQSSGQWASSGALGGSSGGMGSSWVSSFGGSSQSSPFGGGAGEKGRNFFMHVNAELIIYGGTDPKAKVRVDGQEISLRPDGTFSYHFTFKDGKYHIPIQATSPDGEETRAAFLSFLRLSEYTDGVDKTPQPPLPEPIGRVE